MTGFLKLTSQCGKVLFVQIRGGEGLDGKAILG